ncbi:MAG: GH3 auxin-responsive promoter family protein [Bacteroidales bacterium]|nr:GH3 auxin-responsive promoter family protein [Bacteroidales bacterium]MDZ4205475.1 GH3 auxin-responsive promoter family protein [Bacteroidales bacterium]
MPLFNTVISWLMKRRIHQIELFMRYPHEVQMECFKSLINQAENTEWGKNYNFSSIKTPIDFKNRVPLSHYEDLKPYIERMRLGEQNILWPTDIRWFAKSSGTTSDKSKFIPVSREALDECHFKGGKDLLSIYCNNHPNTRLFTGKVLGMSGTHNMHDADATSFHGDVSAILLQHLPCWINFVRTPNRSIALMDEWESKIELMAQITINEDVTNITGVPSWTLILLKRILAATGKHSIAEVWPNLELFVHGGVNFDPYREQFRKITTPALNYLEAYNASEGFFGLQYLSDSSDLLLMLDYGIYYEFIPPNELDNENPNTLQLHQVEVEVPYALVISTNAGLWRYQIGDTIKFTSVSPYSIRITGRTKSFINAVGEELMIENAEKAIAYACEKTKALVNEYTAAPMYFSDNSNAAHEWLIEFTIPPTDFAYFTEMLDTALKANNSDYEAKRHHNLVLRSPVIRTLPPKTFYNWMKIKGKLGGQHKVPRLSNDRKHVEEILTLIKSR